MAFINGWGRGTWGQLEWGQGAVPITLTGLAATSALGAPGVNGKAVASVASLNATLGSVAVTINADANATPSGLASTSALGTLTSVTGKSNITLASQVGTSALGTVTPEAQAKFKKTWNDYNDFILKEATDDLSESQPTAGNIAGGLTTIEEKAFGNFQKIGSRKFIDVLEPAEEPTKGKGLYLRTEVGPGRNTGNGAPTTRSRGERPGDQKQ